MTTFAEAIMNLPKGTIVSLTLKGTGQVIVGAVKGPYVNDVAPSVLIDRADGSDFPVVAIMLRTIADGHEIGGMHSGADQVPIGPRRCSDHGAVVIPDWSAGHRGEPMCAYCNGPIRNGEAR
jgi:hypothetical protein